MQLFSRSDQLEHCRAKRILRGKLFSCCAKGERGNVVPAAVPTSAVQAPKAISARPNQVTVADAVLLHG